MLIDKIHLLVQAGNGGNGCDSHYRRTDKKMVPNGGDGGSGGSIIFRADTNAPPIANLRYKQYLIAESGGHGGATRKRGRNGKDVIVLVPVGTRVYARERNFLIRDLLREGEEVVIVKGGRPGLGNQGGKTPTEGEKGPSLEVELTIRIQADIFLVGLPNSGKSTLLNRLTRTHVKEETYPFATTTPEVGVHVISDYEQLTLCELPSLYRASSEGRGMGNSFLKHLEGARHIFFILDPISKFADSLKEGFEILRNQLEIFAEEYRNVPCSVIITKRDLPEAVARTKAEKFKPKAPLFFISATTGEGMDSLLSHLKELKNAAGVSR